MDHSSKVCCCGPASRRYRSIAARRTVARRANAGSATSSAYVAAEGPTCVLQDANGWAPLHYAVQDERLAVAAGLLQSGGTVDVQTADGLTPLLLAAQRSSLDAVRLLLRHGANADAREVRSRMLPDQC